MIGFLTLSPDLTITQWSEPLVYLTGKTQEEVQGRSLFDVFPELRLSGLEVAVRHVLETGAPFLLSNALHRTILPAADGAPVMQSGQLYPLFQGEEVVGVILTVQDISDRLVVEEELRNTIRLLQAQNDIRRAVLDEEMVSPEQVIVEQALTVSGGVLAHLYLYEEDELKPAAVASVDGEASVPPPAPPLIVEEVFLKGAPLHILNAFATPGYRPFHPHTQAALALPLHNRDRPLGVLYLESAWASSFLGEARQRLQTLASAVAHALHTCAVRRAEKRRTAELDAINRLSEALQKSTQPQDVLEVLLVHSAQALNAHSALLLVPQADPQGLLVRYALGALHDCAGMLFPIEESLTAQAYRLHSPLLAYDLYAAQGAEAVMKEALQRAELPSPSGLFVPVVVQGQVEAVLVLVSTPPARYRTADRQLGQTLAQMGASAIERLRLQAQTRRQVEQLALVNRISQRLAASLDPQRAFQLTVESLVNELGYPLAAVFSLDVKGGELVLEALYSHAPLQDQPGARFPAGQGVAGVVLRTGKTYLCNQCGTDPHYQPWNGFHPGSEICAPVTVGGEIRGVLLVEAPQEDAFSLSDQDLIETLATQLGVAWNNALRFQASERAARRLAIIDQASQRLTFSPSLQTVAEVVLDVSFALLNARRGGVYLVEKDEILRPLALRGVPETVVQRLRETPLSVHTGLFATVFKTRRAVFIPDVKSDPRVEIIPGYTGEQIYCFPLISGSRVIGVVDLDTIPGDEEVMTLVQTFFSRIGTTLENLLLYDQTVRLSQQRAILLNISTQFAAALEMSAVQSDILAGAQSALDADLVWLFSVSGDSLTLLAGNPPLVRAGEWSYPPGTVISVDHCALFQQVLEEKVVLFTSGREIPGKLMHEQGIQDVAAAPLLVGENPIGLLVWGSRRADFFTAEDKRTLLQGVASQAAIALHRGMLNQRLQHHAEELTEMVEARTAQLRAEKERTQAVLDAAGEGIFVLDPQGAFLYGNPAFEHITGYSPAELLANGAWLWLGENTGNLFAEYLASLPQEGMAPRWEKEVRGRRRNGMPLDAVLTLTPVHDEEGRVLEHVGTLQDITRLKELDRLKSEFVSNVSHELRTPLTSIKLYAEQLPGASPERVGRYLAALNRETARLEAMVEDLLTISRLDLGKTRMEIVPLPLAPFVHEIVEDRRMLAQSRGLTLHFQCEEALPPAAGDKRFVMQIVTNLLTNAINYTPAGKNIFITVQRDPQEAHFLRLMIEDEGVGIPAGELPHLFERFFRGSAGRKLQVPGTGLGLSIVKEMVDRLNGTIRMESEEGKGTRAIVCLPVWKEEG
ncbi:GAF domain-containing protein [Anaerolinea thermophila]|uniref:GAF domain-containing protein n=1 Tax=Anaerolinea thermophila TaxID=167964 RepID=UPI0026ECE7E7|nr:GAF domain-containing protein [Anaerolinea thermophila]